MKSVLPLAGAVALFLLLTHGINLLARSYGRYLHERPIILYLLLAGSMLFLVFRMLREKETKQR